MGHLGHDRSLDSHLLMAHTYNRQGEPIDIYEFARLMEDMAYVHVGMAAVGDLTISTVWMGINHNFTFEGPPIIFETMIFGPREEGAPFDEDLDDLVGMQWRYPSEEAALAGHDQAVALVRERVTA